MEESILEKYYLDHRPHLLRFLSKRLGSLSLAEDLTQDLYLKLKSAKLPPSVRDARAYLLGMAANLATDHLRVETRRREILDAADDEIGPQADILSPEHCAIACAELAHLEAAVAKLDPRCREVFYLVRYAGKTQSEVADALGVGSTTVYKDLKKVMAALTAARRQFRGTQPNKTGKPDPASID